MVVPQFKLSFDVGHGDPQLTDLSRFALSHGHLDHASGLPFIVSQRSLRHLPAPDIYCPPEVAGPLGKILELWGQLDDHQAEFTIIPTEYDRLYPLANRTFLRALPAVHRVPANGYVIVEKTEKLKQEFLGLPGPEIARLKKERDDMFYETQVPLVAYSGDTQIEFVLENEIVRKSKTLFLDCTYISDDRDVERARKWGHAHLDEIIANADAFRDVERLFLIHISPRYSAAVVRDVLKKKLPESLFEKTEACV